MRRSATIAVFAIAILATPALAQPTPGVLTGPIAGGKVRYRWQRGATTIELKDATAAWSQAEADLVKQALDKLPDVLFKNSLRDRKVNEFRRDKVPVASLGRKRSNASATTVVESGYVSYGDVLFANLDPMRVYATVIHEIGHVAQYSLLGSGGIFGKLRATTLGTPGWTGISWTSPITDGLKSWNGFVSDYARTNDREDFAESVEFYWLAPEELLHVSREKFTFIRNKVFEGETSPLASRDPNKKAIAPVRPEITQLGDTKDNYGSLVKVSGKYFIGPRDSGFNTVRYGTKKALHLTVSRKTIHSWVPTTTTGQAPVTVTTQDGTSNAAPFEVTKKPWWKFW